MSDSLHNEYFYQTLLENAFDGVHLSDVNGKILYVSPGAIRLLGYQESEVLHRYSADFTHPNDLPQILQVFRQALKNPRQPFHAEARFRHHEGHYLHIRATFVNLLHHTDVRAIVVNYQDISERKAIETKLRESEALYRHIAELAPRASINILNRDFEVVFSAGQVYSYMPITPDDFLGKNVHQWLSPRNAALFISFFQKTLKGESCQFEWSNKLGDFIVYTLPLSSEGGSIQLFLLVFQDITEIKKKENELRHVTMQLLEQKNELFFQKNELTQLNQRLRQQRQQLKMVLKKLDKLNDNLTFNNRELQRKEQELSALNEELHKANKELALKNQELALQEEELHTFNEQLLSQQNDLKKMLDELADRNFELDQIVYRTSHDIRSPLTSTLGLINLMKMEGVPPHLQEYTQRIEDSMLKLDRFVTGMLNFAKSNRSERRSDIVDFEGIIQKCLDDFRYLPNYAHVNIRYAIEYHSGQVFRSDVFRVEIIFANIISNAIKYSQPKRDDSFLEIRIGIEEHQVELYFRDNGIGIKQEYLDKVFDMFFRATERSEGSGLGLYIVRQTVEKLNGHIDIQSVYGEGTLFHITLPNLSS